MRYCLTNAVDGEPKTNVYAAENEAPPRELRAAMSGYSKTLARIDGLLLDGWGLQPISITTLPRTLSEGVGAIGHLPQSPPN